MKRPEEQLQRAVVHYLHILEMQGHLVFFATSNQRGTRTRYDMGILKAMGVRAGAPDLCIMSKRMVGFIELKSEKGRMSPAQIAFAEDCYRLSIPHAVCRSLEEVQGTLRGWGVIKEASRRVAA